MNTMSTKPEEGFYNKGLDVPILEADMSEGKKMMSMEDVSECLQKDFSEEIEDSKKYLCMAKIAESAGDYHDCHYLLEMAKDEYTHACFIRDFMLRHDMHISDVQECCYKKLEERMSEFFRA